MGLSPGHDAKLEYQAVTSQEPTNV
jgi:hypothetical protein